MQIVAAKRAHTFAAALRRLETGMKPGNLNVFFDIAAGRIRHAINKSHKRADLFLLVPTRACFCSGCGCVRKLCCSFCLHLTNGENLSIHAGLEGAEKQGTYFEIGRTYFKIPRTYFFFSPGGAKAGVRKLTFYRVPIHYFCVCFVLWQCKGSQSKTYKTDMGINALYNKARFTHGS